MGIIDHGELIALGTQAELTHQVGEIETLILHVGENEDPERLALGMQDMAGCWIADVTDHTLTVIVPEAEEAARPRDYQGQRTRCQDPLGGYARAQPGSGFPAPDREGSSRLETRQ